MGDCGEEGSSLGDAGGIILRPPAGADFPVMSGECWIVVLAKGSVKTGEEGPTRHSQHTWKAVDEWWIMIMGNPWTAREARKLSKA
jgi:hypothetical protein